MNHLIPSAREALLNGDWSWDASSIVLILVDETYVFDEAHDTVADLTGVIATSAPLTGKTTTDGAADADNVVFTGIADGTIIAGMWVAVDAGALLVWIDTRIDDQPLNEEADGGDITVYWDSEGVLVL